MAVHIKISDADFAALPEPQRFLLEQIMERHPPIQHKSYQFTPQKKGDEVANEKKLDSVQNGLGGYRSAFDPNRRLIP